MSKIYVFDEFSPEDIAMIQALYSRSEESVINHVTKVKNAGSGKFMEKYYVGYGHKSIADCGSTTIFHECVSILAAKAIQDWPLYSGQESSTRYIDYSKQPCIDPLDSYSSRFIQGSWISFYLSSLEPLKKHLKTIYPRKEGEKKGVYNKAIKAHAFDILRGFLPAGMTTQLSWHTNLRQAWDKLSLLHHHPLEEVSSIALKVLSSLRDKYPNSFSHGSYQETEDYHSMLTANYTYFNKGFVGDVSDVIFKTDISYRDLYDYKNVIESRPPKTNLPCFMTDLGLCTFKYFVDFGSFRDLQRHRNGVCRMPLLTMDYGFNQWYLDQLPGDVRKKAVELIKQQSVRTSLLVCSEETRQYYIAMGFNVLADVTYGLPAAVYVIELRSGKHVHSTLRKRAIDMHYLLKDKFPFLKLHTNLDPDDWDIRRGTQDIQEK